MRTWMRSERGSRRRLGVGVLSMTLLVLTLPGSVAGATDLLPDLAMASLTDFHLQTTGTGRKLIRFDTIIVNIGDGPLEITGRRDCSSLASCPKMKVRQVIHDSDGDVRYTLRPGNMKYAGDGHNHWHVQKIETYEIFRKSAPTTTRSGAKVGYCFFDNVAYRLSLPNAPNQGVYRESGCGVSSSLAARVGLSVGWGDLYPWNFVYQWIDITGLPAGEYRVCVTTDLGNRYLETSDSNNRVWQDVALTSGGGLIVRGKGWSKCRPDPASAGAGSPSASPPDYPESHPIAADEPGSSTCRIPSTSEKASGPAGAGSRSMPVCRMSPSGGGWLAPEPAERGGSAVVRQAAALASTGSGEVRAGSAASWFGRSRSELTCAIG